MIRCSHCGKLAPVGATSCQSCGMPLVSANNNPGTRGKGQSDAELPAWLESLRAHERPVSSGGGGQPFSMAELVDENAMPSWMRQDQSRLAENSDAFPALSSGPQPATNPEKQAFPAKGLEASSLIDQTALPTWMRDQQAEQPKPGQSVSANSLVQRDDLPAWMKTLDQAGGGIAPVQVQQMPQQAPVTPPPPAAITRPPAASLQQGFTAGELVDAQSLPNWMTSGQGPGQPLQNKPVPTEKGFTAGDLIDQRALPNWMRDGQSQKNSEPESAMGVPVNGSGQGTGQGIQQGGVGMPASMLLDMGSMPSWMREGEQGRSTGAAFVPGTPQQPMAANSLIDMNEMPAWMREAHGNSGQQPAGNVRNVPLPRAVPSRPRAEAAPLPQNAQAAHMFSSMLGVAASSPLLPGQGQPEPPMAQTPNNPRVSQHPTGLPTGWQSQQPSTPVQAVPPSPTAWQFSGSMPRVPAAQQGQEQSMQSAIPPQAPANNVEWPGYSSISGAHKAVGRGDGAAANNQARPAKKKSFFDSIRDFISK